MDPSTYPGFQNAFAVIWLAALIGAALLGIRNLRRGSVDHRGAFRIAVFMFVVDMTYWICFTNHVLVPAGEEYLLLRGLSGGLFMAIRIWLYYIAVEPFARRLWPQILVSWSRLVDGRLRDPLVGRHLLIGGATALAFGILYAGYELLWDRFGLEPPPLSTDTPLSVLEGTRAAIAQIAFLARLGVEQSLVMLVVLLVLRVVLRKQWLAVAAFCLMIAMTTPFESFPDYALSLASTIAAVVLLTRVGLLALGSFWFFMFLMVLPFSLDSEQWYFGTSLFILGVGTAVAVYGFYVSQAGRPVFGDKLLESEAVHR